jgi:hypothetical protein
MIRDDIDASAADPFGHAGFAGTLDRRGDREAYLALLAGRGNGDRAGQPIPDQDVAYYLFRNGWGAGVLLADDAHPACISCRPGQPFEMSLMHADLTPCDEGDEDGDMWCSLDAEGVRSVLDAISGRSTAHAAGACAGRRRMRRRRPARP